MEVRLLLYPHKHTLTTIGCHTYIVTYINIHLTSIAP